MAEEAGWLTAVVALLATGLLAAWTARACLQAQQRDSSPSDVLVWSALAAVFVGYSQLKLVRGLGWLTGFGGWLRSLARQHGLYADRRAFQIIATVAVALGVIVLFVYGLMWIWHYIKRYRLAIGFASLAVGFGLIRFISLHEVDAWTAANPWARPLIELVACAGASTLALVRLHQLGELPRLFQRFRA